VAERDQQLSAGVPGLIDQYKQRRQAWLAQADELVRLRDEVRSAAEHEALEIVTAARRDVRRIVVEARRELLVLTAQLHAAIESVDQAQLQAAAETASGAEAEGHAATDVLAGQRSLGATEDRVLGARREVRTVLDEARAEIEALSVEAHAPLREIPAALVGSSRHADAPIPTLETILGADPLSVRNAGAGPLPKVDLDQLPIDSMSHTENDHDDDSPGGAGGGGTLPRTWQQSPESRPTSAGSSEPLGGRGLTSLAVAEPTLVVHPVEEAASFVAAPVHAPVQVGGLYTADEPVVEPLSGFGETGPLQLTDQGRTFLVDYEEDGPRTRPAWMWVGLFAATGILAIVGTVWWFTLRDSGTALATSVSEGSEPAPAADVTPIANRATAAPAAAAGGPSGLGIEVRRTAWIRTVVDGKEDSRVYQAGETRQIVGARTVSIRAGDGGAVFVSVDGRPAEALGSGGLAVTRQYSLAGGASTPVPAVATSSPAVAVEPLAATPTTTPARPPVPQALPAPPGARPAEVRTATGAGATPAPGPSLVAAPPAPALPEGAAPSGGGRADLIAAGQQWLDAYQRRDRDGMSSSGTENMTISDERSVTERFPAWQAGVRRDLDQLELELSGDTALLTARMTERNGDGATTSAQHVSRVSQIWVRRSGRWRLADVRIIGEARLNQIVR
jgi:ketosteroid isomerase-like protein